MTAATLTLGCGDLSEGYGYEDAQSPSELTAAEPAVATSHEQRRARRAAQASFTEAPPAERIGGLRELPPPVLVVWDAEKRQQEAAASAAAHAAYTNVHTWFERFRAGHGSPKSIVLAVARATPRSPAC